MCGCSSQKTWLSSIHYMPIHEYAKVSHLFLKQKTHNEWIWIHLLVYNPNLPFYQCFQTSLDENNEGLFSHIWVGHMFFLLMPFAKSIVSLAFCNLCAFIDNCPFWISCFRIAPVPSCTPFPWPEPKNDQTM